LVLDEREHIGPVIVDCLQTWVEQDGAPRTDNPPREDDIFCSRNGVERTEPIVSLNRQYHVARQRKPGKFLRTVGKEFVEHQPLFGPAYRRARIAILD